MSGASLKTKRIAAIRTAAKAGKQGLFNRAGAALGMKPSTLRAWFCNLPDYVSQRNTLDFVALPAEVAKPAAAPDVVQDLRDQIARLKADERDGFRKSAIVTELAGVLERTVKPLVYPFDQLIARPAPARGAEKVDAVVTLSDQHADRIIAGDSVLGLERYDFDAFRARLYEWAKMIGRYCTVHLPRYQFETLWVLHLGDAVNGDIHDMKLRNQFANSLVAAVNTGDAQAEAFAYLAPMFKRIKVVCVSGNHGRTTTRIQQDDPWDNFDYLVARQMQARLAHIPNIEVVIPKAWVVNIDIRGKLVQLNHGHGVKGTWGIPWYGFERREGRMQRLAAMVDRTKPIDYFFYGHFHSPMNRPAGQAKAFHAGAWYLTDPYQLNELAVGNEPEQTLLVWSDRFGPQIQIPLFVRDRVREEQMRAGTYDPPFGRQR